MADAATTDIPPSRSSMPCMTVSGVPIQRVYGPADIAGLSPAHEIGDAGAFPFTRGIHADMYRGRLWTMRQFAGFGGAQETNERFRYLLDHGRRA